MNIILYLVLSCVFLQAESTDIIAVYKHGIIRLDGAESKSSIQDADDLFVKLPQDFTFPVALTHEPSKGTLFIADLNDEETDVFAIHTKDKKKSVSAFVSKLGSTTIESLVYDPIEQKIIWTDSSKNGIYSAKVPEEKDLESPSTLVYNTDVFNPRGISLDFCNRVLYWTERYNNERTIEKYNLENKTVEIVAKADSNVYYQAIDFNSFTSELIWAQTTGDEEFNSSCTIMIQSLGESPKPFASFDHCYPFSLTSDQHFIYWSDWSRSGIMRLSKSDPTSLIKLVHTPKVDSKSGGHNGAFGIVNMDQASAKDICPHSLDKYRPMSIAPPTLFKNVPKLHQGFGEKENDDAPADSKFSSIEDSATSSAHTFHDFSLRRLRLIVILLSILALFFMTTTIILLARSFCAYHLDQKVIKGILMSIAPVTPTDPFSTTSGKRKQHRRFGQTNSKVFDSTLCPRVHDDGVRIDIEDCCQMTLCDTPCYTAAKKEGKGYKSSPFRESKNEDKKCLLENDLA